MTPEEEKEFDTEFPMILHEHLGDSGFNDDIKSWISSKKKQWQKEAYNDGYKQSHIDYDELP